MRRARIASLLIRQIESYRRSEVAAMHAGSCPFAPSCSHYGETALRRRALPVALVLIAWRLLRCRRSVARGTWDPVPMPSRRRGVKVAGVLLLSGIVTLGTAGLAEALVPTSETVGGCIASIDGRDITTMNRNHPLVVQKGQRVIVDGKAPVEFQSRPEPPGAATLTKLRITLVSPLQVDTKAKVSRGWKKFTSLQDVDTYLKFGGGLYRLTVLASGSDVQTEGWSCSATFYAKLEGGTAAAFGAGLAAAVGFAGAATAAGQSDWAEDDVIPPDAEGAEPDSEARRRSEGAVGGCLAILALFLFGTQGEGMWGAGAVGGLLSAPRTPDADGRFWRRGHPVRGFIGGLFTGLGLAVLMQQRGYWVLTWQNAIAFPLVLALVFGWRGWRGRPFRVTYPRADEPAAESA
jgi:putative component of membrane protein insertase Oxa1/YidC/SpoIIIJ protein YidD